jgi:hypothetical protein
MTIIAGMTDIWDEQKGSVERWKQGEAQWPHPYGY